MLFVHRLHCFNYVNVFLLTRFGRAEHGLKLV